MKRVLALYANTICCYMLLFIFALFASNKLYAQEPAKSSTATELNNMPPDAEKFRKGLLNNLPATLLKMKEIVAEHKADEDDTTSLYPLETVMLPGTLDNCYEYVTDGMLVFDADLRCIIEKDMTDASATKRTAAWKLMLQKAFPELAPKMEDKTDATGNQFITITQPRTLISNEGKPGYTTSPGWTLTMQNTKGKIGREMCLVLVPSNK